MCWPEAEEAPAPAHGSGRRGLLPSPRCEPLADVQLRRPHQVNTSMEWDRLPASELRMKESGREEGQPTETAGDNGQWSPQEAAAACTSRARAVSWRRGKIKSWKGKKVGVEDGPRTGPAVNPTLCPAQRGLCSGDLPVGENCWSTGSPLSGRLLPQNPSPRCFFFKRNKGLALWHNG